MAPWFRYPHCGRPNPSVESLSRHRGFTILTVTDQTPFMESLPRRRGFTILTVADQTPPWKNFYGVAVSLSSLRLPNALCGITSTASWFHYPHCDRPNSVDSVPQRNGRTILTAAAKHSPLESLSRCRGSTTQDFPPRNGVCSIRSGCDFPSLPLFSSQSSRVNR